jgi:Cft2 family RNA processing exonuclease
LQVLQLEALLEASDALTEPHLDCAGFLSGLAAEAANMRVSKVYLTADIQRLAHVCVRVQVIQQEIDSGTRSKLGGLGSR